MRGGFLTRIQLTPYPMISRPSFPMLRKASALLASLLTGLTVACHAGADQSQLDPHQTLKLGAKSAETFRILCIGDSITRHGASEDTKTRLGWDHVAGMAATEESKDYAHLLAAKVQAALPTRKVELYFHTFGGSGKVGQRLSAIDKVLPVEPDLVIVQLGEHEREPDGTEQLRADYAKLLTAFDTQKEPPLVIATGTWNPNLNSSENGRYRGWAATIDSVFSSVCAELNVPFVPVNELALDPVRSGWGSSQGVRWHPNDQGHAGYAERIFAALSAQLQAGTRRTPLITTPDPILEASISVNAVEMKGPVNPFVFGHNIEAADGAGIFSGTVRNSLLAGTGVWDPKTKEPNPAVMARMKNDLRTGMLRYPGGCLAHNFDWRKAVGPLESRGDWQFGINEFIALCRAYGAEPIFTISDYVLPADDMPRHASELVEYLNSPATPDHPWAMKRKEWGHPEPFGVKWFELGNESDHGNHNIVPKRIYTSAQYARYATTTAAAMRAVDPSIKIGILTLPGDGTNFDSEWNHTILRSAGSAADFVIVHLYVPKAGKQGLAAAMAVGDQVTFHFETLQKLVRAETGRDLPFAVTEFNASIDSHDPVRFSYGAGLASADLVRYFLDPASHVVTANYWNVLNGWFGMLHGASDGTAQEPMSEKAAYPLFRLWGRHFGDQLIGVNVESPRVGFPGAGSVYAANGDSWIPTKSTAQVDVLPLLSTDGLEQKGIPARITQDGELKILLNEATGDRYPVIATLPRTTWPGAGALEYRISFEARFVAEGDQPHVALGIGLADPRGWKATGSAIAVRGISEPDWKSFSGEYLSLPDATGLDLVARLELGKSRATGRLEVRNLRIDSATPPTAPAFNLVTASASLSKDGQTLYVIAFNKSERQAVSTHLNLSGFTAAGAKRWEVNAPSLAALTGVSETVSGEPLVIEGGSARVTLPAHSMTAIEFSKQ
jgi:alpha-N-arabinofuranosidase